MTREEEDSGLRKREPKFFYGYIIVVAAFCIQVIVWGIFNTFGVFFNPLLDEFGWARATISGASSLCFLLMGLISIIAGRLSDRIGPRLVITVCGLFIGLGYLLMSQVNAVWQLYLFYGVVLAVGLSAMDVVPLSTVARWFVKKRGVVSGIAKVGAGAGMLIMPLIASWLISGYGWRTSYVVMGSVVLFLVILAAQFLRRDPSQKGLVAYGAEEAEVGNLDSEEGFSLQEATRTRQFWMLCGMYLLLLFCVHTILVHIVPHAIALGISAASAATVLAIIGGVSIVGRVVMGSAGDRVGSRLAMTICFLMLVVALFWLQIAGELWMLYLFAIIYGFAHGGFFALISPLVAELFGLRSHGVIFGTALFSGTIGGATGQVLAGRIFDVTGSYQLGFLVCALLAVAGFILTLFLRPTGKKP